MQSCLPTDCEWCDPWGSSVPDKARCRKPPIHDNMSRGYEYHRGWRFSTTLGGSCVMKQRDEQLSLFADEEDTNA